MKDTLMGHAGTWAVRGVGRGRVVREGGGCRQEAARATAGVNETDFRGVTLESWRLTAGGERLTGGRARC